MKEACCILLVDDDVTLLELFSTVLRAEGHRVLTADTGARALQIAKECKPDLLLLDVLLPDVSGIEVCREIKADPQLADAFVVLCTGAAKSVGEKLEGLKAGAEDYLEKAFELEELKARVRTFARLHDSSVALRNSERHYRALFEGSPVAVMLADIDGNILDVNEAQCRLSGYSRG